MLEYAAKAYQNTSQKTVSSRQLEADLLLRGAAKLQAVKENWEAHNTTLLPAILFNRKLWIILASAVSDETRDVPQSLRQSFSALSVYILNRLQHIEAMPAPDILDVVISINREIAAGLNE